LSGTIHFLSIGIRDESSAIGPLTKLAQRAGVSDRIVDDPDDADRLVVCDLHHQPRLSVRRLIAERYGRAALARTVCYDERDRPYPEFPGLFVGVAARHVDGAAIRPWAYPPYACNGHVVRATLEPERLVSFVGSPTHPVREQLFGLSGDEVLIRRVDGFMFFQRDGVDDEQIRASYAADLMSSAFVLCPRGHGTSSIRLFETMRAGRVPVIVSDDWAPPVGLDWESFSIRVPERDVASVVEICRDRATEAVAMGRRAADAFEQWFAADVYMRHFIDLIGALEPRLPRSASGVRAVRRVQRVKGTFTGRVAARRRRAAVEH
jgi:hypothetical protein